MNPETGLTPAGVSHHSFMESAGGLGTFFIVVYILLRIAKSEEEFKEAGKGT